MEKTICKRTTGQRAGEQMREAGAQTLAVSSTRFLLARILYPRQHRRELFICLKLGRRIKAQEDTSVDAWGCFFLGGGWGEARMG